MAVFDGIEKAMNPKKDDDLSNLNPDDITEEDLKNIAKLIRERRLAGKKKMVEVGD